jgi:hypothetical protein
MRCRPGFVESRATGGAALIFEDLLGDQFDEEEDRGTQGGNPSTHDDCRLPFEFDEGASV